MTWNQIVDDPALQDLPYKIETNEHGYIIMSPAKKWHSKRQARIVRKLERLIQNGEIYTELGISTSQGVKVPDVAWCSPEFDAVHEAEDYALTAAPELCIEVLSESNGDPEIREKTMLYFAHGAAEVWLCNNLGSMIFYLSPTQVVEKSRLFPEFPAQI